MKLLSRPMRGTIRPLFFALALLVSAALLSSFQSTVQDELTTPERLSKSPWWPTKPASPSDKYAGTAACAECHSDIVRTQKESEMSQTLMAAEKSAVLAEHAGKNIKVDGFTYDLIRDAKGMSFRMRSGSAPISMPLTWAFGSGTISQVYLTPGDTTFNETHFSYFDSIHGFDTTPAQPTLGDRIKQEPDASASKRAAGRTVQMREVRRCFGCHAAKVNSDGPIADVIPGVTCETCHGPGGNHVATMRAGIDQGTSLIMNPARLRPVARVDFCGACHVTSMDILMAGNSGPPTVRFPAYRLQNSRCWRDDARIQCTACHDPHKPLDHAASNYDSKCLACHITAASAKPDALHPGAACPVATKECVTCHMPKYDFSDVHHKFTDHQIRVVRVGAPFPG